MLKSLLFIFGFLIVGELVSWIFQLPVAGNILGMLLIFIALKLQLISLESVKPASDKLIKYLVIFFIPYGVGLMVHFNLIAEFWLPISLAVIFSSVLTLYLTAIIIEKAGR
ncbi:CidA/LrgA family protein [Salegentibacter sp. F14]